MGFALSECVELVDGLVARLRIPRGDVHSSTVGHEALRDHATNAFSTASDEHNLAL